MSAGRTVLITGAGHGLGLEWARQDLADGAVVFATARDPEDSPDLRRLAEEAGAALTVLPMDVCDDASVERCAGEVGSRVRSLDGLINNAGVHGPRDDRALRASAGELRRVLEVNTIGPYRVTRAFLPLLRNGREARVVFVTSRMGSIGDTPSGGSYAYRMSKSALNMLGANLARDLRSEGILCLVLHPGWVRTRMGGERAPLSAPAAVGGMRRVAAGATIRESGAFLDHTGAPVPW